MLFDTIAELAVDIESVHTETTAVTVSEDFPRKTTTVLLEGPNAIGKGEDVIYDAALHEYPECLAKQLKGMDRFDVLSDRLEECQLFDEGRSPTPTQRNYRRWAIESAALDLALKQAETTLAQAVERNYHPVRFVVSPSLGEHTLDELRQLIGRIPGIEFKLDVKAEWDRDLIADLATLDRVRVVDFKSHYSEFGRDPDYELYRMVAEGFTDALLEDPKITDETRSAFDGQEHRVSWDKPITGIDSIEHLPFHPSQLNMKPSRFGSVESLLDTIEYCQNHGIHLYGGGQFELDVGRQHIQAVASLFYPDAPNDVAPRLYNGADIPENPPHSPLEVDPGLSGLQWRYRH